MKKPFQLTVALAIMSMLLSACVFSVGVENGSGAPAADVTTAPMDAPTSEPPASIGTMMVVFVKDGNIQVWDEETRQTRTILNTGDAFSVTTSDDAQRIAFTRRSWVGEELDGYEQFALWAMDRDGGTPRQLVSAQDVRQQLSPSERDSSNFYQLGWVPQSHRLIFSGTKYIVQAEGLSHAIPQGAYLVDTDSGSVTVLADAAEYVRFVASPDGQQVALMSPTSVGFINADGSNRRANVLTFSEAGSTAPLFPVGVWTQDSRAFVVTGSFQRDVNYNVNFTIWRIPMDGSSPAALAAVTGSQPSSVAFSPDGKSAAFLQAADQQPSEIAGWAITSLVPEAGPLALPYFGKEASYASLHWSPAGNAFAIKDQDLVQLCPNATQDSQVCGEPVHLGSRIITQLQWVDASRFLFVGNEPNTLSLGKLDGTVTSIATWAESNMVTGWSFYIAG